MSNDDNVELTDGFHVLIDALKMNDIDTMYGVVGIPITNLARMWQDDGQRFYSFRHEQHAGYAASIAGYIEGKPERLLDRFRPWLPERRDFPGSCNHQLLPNDPVERFQ